MTNKKKRAEINGEKRGTFETKDQNFVREQIDSPFLCFSSLFYLSAFIYVFS